MKALNASRQFTLWAGLTSASSSGLAQEPPENTLPSNNIGIIHNEAGKAQCNFAVLGGGFILTSEHCPFEKGYYSVKGSEHQRQVWVSDINDKAITLKPDALKKAEADDGSPYVNAEQYVSIANDKQVRLLGHDFSADQRGAKIAPLDSLPWKPAYHQGADHVQDEPTDFAYINVKMFSYRPDDYMSNTYSYEVKNCHLLRVRNTQEALATTCVARHGQSGSPIVFENQDGSYSIVAIMSRYAFLDALDDKYVQKFSEIASLKRIYFASAAGSLERLCLGIKECDLEYDSAGHFTMSYRP